MTQIGCSGNIRFLMGGVGYTVAEARAVDEPGGGAITLLFNYHEVIHILKFEWKEKKLSTSKQIKTRNKKTQHRQQAGMIWVLMISSAGLYVTDDDDTTYRLGIYGWL